MSSLPLPSLCPFSFGIQAQCYDPTRNAHRLADCVYAKKKKGKDTAHLHKAPVDRAEDKRTISSSIGLLHAMIEFELSECPSVRKDYSC